MEDHPQEQTETCGPLVLSIHPWGSAGYDFAPAALLVRRVKLSDLRPVQICELSVWQPSLWIPGQLSQIELHGPITMESDSVIINSGLRAWPGAPFCVEIACSVEGSEVHRFSGLIGASPQGRFASQLLDRHGRVVFS